MTPLEPERQIEVLLVEDDPGDVLMTREAFQTTSCATSCTSSTTAPRRWRSCGRKVSTPAGRDPDLVLLDLNLPEDGRAGGPGGHQVRPGPGEHPGRGADDVRDRGRRAAQLLAARQRLRDEAGGLRALHRGGPPDRRLLRLGGAAAVGSRRHAGARGVLAVARSVQRSRRSIPRSTASRPNGTSRTRNHRGTFPPLLLP